LSVSRNTTDPQIIFDVLESGIERAFLPNPAALVMGGVYWGRAEVLFTPAFWAAQAWYHRNSTRYCDFAWSDDLRREIVGCLLGGHGISSEMNQAAFERLEQSGLFDRPAPIYEEEIVELLRIPFTVAGRPVRYRFPAQKSRFVAAALQKIEQHSTPIREAAELRKWLLSFPGIGMKTASWITRNHLRANTVAVIDIHIFRAGVIMGLYSGREVVYRDYIAMEQKFIRFADRICVPVDKLDVIIWRTMKDSRKLGLNSYRNAA
jgi:N-glycosylase/DNA lyase